MKISKKERLKAVSKMLSQAKLTGKKLPKVELEYSKLTFSKEKKLNNFFKI